MEDIFQIRSTDQFAIWDTNPDYPLETNDQLFSSNWSSFDCNLFDHENLSTLENFQPPCNFLPEDFNYFNDQFNCPLLGIDYNDFTVPQFSTTDSSYSTSLDSGTPQFQFSEDLVTPVTIIEEKDLGVIANDLQSHEMQATCKGEPVRCLPAVPLFNVGACPEKKTTRAGKQLMEGQQSKNLMAERRRRKRLNDRLSMLRSIVPKISKMDRTSILGDTIDYMKELLERINNLQQEIDQVGSDQLDIMSIIKEAKASDHQIIIRNSPKFDVERRNLDTKVEICCAEKPGLLLSTLTTLDALGLEIQQCVISSFSDFTMQASCTEELEQRTQISSEDIKQALFRSAGYQGRCL